MSQRLSNIIRDHIRKSGPMPLDEYMSLCLGHPTEGYYMKKDPFGAGGDFVTAPEVSQLFGEMIGAWLADMWLQLGSPEKINIIECGPGRGTLMADALRAAAHVPGYMAAVNLHLLEISPVLKDRQMSALGKYNPVWIDSLEQVGREPVLIIGNEFLDALPVCQIRRENGHWQERAVEIDGGGFMFVYKPLRDDLKHISEARFIDSDNEIYEVSPAVEQFILACGNLIKEREGAALFIDYGYEQSRSGDTVQAMRSHRFKQVLDSPGDNDLTAHVNFQALVQAVKSLRLSAYGPVSQKDFLENMGIGLRYARLIERADNGQRAKLASDMSRLLHPAEMGTLFKACAFCSDPKLKPGGF